jgi:hypothetical protein
MEAAATCNMEPEFGITKGQKVAESTGQYVLAEVGDQLKPLSEHWSKSF